MTATFSARSLFIPVLLSCFTCLAGIAQLPAQDSSSPAVSPANADWPYHGNDVANTRYQNLDQIGLQNASTLQPAWIFHTGVKDSKTSMEMSPIVLNGVMYVTTGNDKVFALNAATGKQLWQYQPADMPAGNTLRLCCSNNNRGVAVAEGRVFLGRLDATLIAIDASNGHQLWKTAVDDYTKGYSITMAPQYVDKKVIVGVAGGENLIRGHLDAYDPYDGHLIWRFWTTEQNTWAGNSWQNGGAPVWQTPSYDPNLGLLYFGTGNPSPVVNGSQRAGQNLYSVCIVALKIKTGQLRWYFQEVHHDLWDYDATPPMVLFSLNGTPALAHVGKSGYLFILDRRFGNPLYPVKEVQVPNTPVWQNPWPTQPESTVDSLTAHSVLSATPPGYTAARQWTPPQEKSYAMQPGTDGGVEWPPMAYSPRTGYIYHHARYAPQKYHTTPTSLSGGLTPGWGSTSDPVPGIQNNGVYGAVDTATGKIAWQIPVKEPPDSGMTVAGDLVFFGESNGLFHAVDAKAGKVLWTFDATTVAGAGGATAAPVAYMVNGQEFIANAFGGNPGEDNAAPGDAIIAFALPK